MNSEWFEGQPISHPFPLLGFGAETPVGGVKRRDDAAVACSWNGDGKQLFLQTWATWKDRPCGY